MERCQNLRLSVDDFEGIGRFALENGIALVVVGPELPLSWGITDYLQPRSGGIRSQQEQERRLKVSLGQSSDAVSRDPHGTSCCLYGKLRLMWKLRA